MAEALLGHWLAQAHEHGRPDDGVEADDLLAHDVHAGPPALFVIAVAVVAVAQCGNIVGEGVDPDIDHMTGVEVHGHAPAEAGPGDAQVLQSRVDEVAHHLVDPGAGLQEVRVFQQVPDFVRVLAQAEEIGLLLRVLDGAAAVGAAAVLKLALRPEGLAGGAVFALVGPLVDIAVVVHFAEDILNGFHMVFVGGADEAVVGDVHQLPQVPHAPGTVHNAVHKFLGSDAGLPGLILDFLAVLVGAGEEHDVLAKQAVVAGQGVRGHGAVGVADVELVRGVVNRSGDIEFFLIHGVSPLKRRPRMEGTPGLTGI